MRFLKRGIILVAGVMVSWWFTRAALNAHEAMGSAFPIFGAFLLGGWAVYMILLRILW
jgi:hypothetical protein